jgi:hypothetical protein
LLFKRKKKMEQGIGKTLFTVAPLLLTLFDYGTDVSFSYFLYLNAEHVAAWCFWLSVASIVVPIVLNFGILYRLLPSEEFNRHWFVHAAVMALVTAMATLNCELAGILSSELLGLDAFKAPLPPRTKALLSVYSIATLITEDITQAVVQLYVVFTRRQPLETIQLVSLVTTGFALFVGLVKKLLGSRMLGTLKRPPPFPGADSSGAVELRASASSLARCR